MRLPRWTVGPGKAAPIQAKNFFHVEADAVGVGIAAAAGSFLPVFLTRLGATSFQVGLLSAMPAIGGLFLCVAVGRFLQRQRRIVPWLTGARVWVLSGRAAEGLVLALPVLAPAQLPVRVAPYRKYRLPREGRNPP